MLNSHRRQPGTQPAPSLNTMAVSDGLSEIKRGAERSARSGGTRPSRTAPSTTTTEGRAQGREPSKPACTSAGIGVAKLTRPSHSLNDPVPHPGQHSLVRPNAAWPRTIGTQNPPRSPPTPRYFRSLRLFPRSPLWSGPSGPPPEPSVTSGRNLATRAGPIPRTASRSSNDAKAPLEARYSTIAAALATPMPGNALPAPRPWRGSDRSAAQRSPPRLAQVSTGRAGRAPTGPAGILDLFRIPAGHQRTRNSLDRCGAARARRPRGGCGPKKAPAVHQKPAAHKAPQPICGTLTNLEE